MNSEPDCLGLSQLHTLLSVSLWTSYFDSVCLTFAIYKIGIIMVPYRLLSELRVEAHSRCCRRLCYSHYNKKFYSQEFSCYKNKENDKK